MKMRFYRLVCLAVCALGVALAVAGAAERQYTEEELLKIMQEAGELRSTEDIAGFIKKYPELDGVLSAGFTGMITSLLAGDEGTVKDLKAQMKSDKDFNKFVLEQIGSADDATLRKIIDNFSGRYDDKTGAAIRKTAEDALRELRQYQKQLNQ